MDLWHCICVLLLIIIKHRSMTVVCVCTHIFISLECVAKCVYSSGPIGIGHIFISELCPKVGIFHGSQSVLMSVTYFHLLFLYVI